MARDAGMRAIKGSGCLVMYVADRQYISVSLVTPPFLLHPLFVNPSRSSFLQHPRAELSSPLIFDFSSNQLTDFTLLLV